jgi:drug/metabolite transporter (DMT)-like permease
MGRAIMNNAMNWIMIAVYVLTTVGGLVLLKLGTNGSALLSVVDGKMIWNIGLLSVVGIVFYGISFLLYTFLISQFNLGFIVPLTTALVYILVFIASFIIFHESFSWLKIIAIVMIIGGVILLNVAGTDNDKIDSGKTEKSNVAKIAASKK